MSQSARVTAIAAVRDFQAFLGEFCEDAREALCAIEMEARRTLDWVQHDQLAYWRKAVRDRQDDLTQAKAALFRKELSRLSGEKPDLIEEKEAVWLAEERLHEAEEKVEKCRRWAPLVQRAIEEYEATARQLAGLVEGTPPAAVVLLGQILTALDSYTFLTPPAGAAPASPAPAPVEPSKGEASCR
jgi:hypothetical protein